MYDVIIAGASFAGLAVASQLRGATILLDRQPIGAGQTSTCAMPLGVAMEWGCQDAIQQVHHAFYIHTGSCTFRYSLYYPFCTVDYAAFCRTLFSRCRAEFRQAAVTGVEGDSVVTGQGSFQGRFLVDASGWRAALEDPRTPHRHRTGLSFGLETLVTHQLDGLHFWVDRNYGNQGYGWAFPAGEQTRFGLASYQGDTHLKPGLTALLSAHGLEMGQVHGGFIPFTAGPATRGDVFLVGDAAGQCLPLTGEGIRPALHFGRFLGETIQAALDGRISPRNARLRYQAFLGLHWPFFAALWLMQKTLPAMADPLVVPFAHLLRLPPLRWLAMFVYRGICWF
ncbi:MAG: NAD(P)/FAD-dependent oxidoreductase [Chloroflexota bacterium]|nr:NAD(P)/FAD-dependent oxidoreductase [Chloroflexota bacterium]